MRSRQLPRLWLFTDARLGGRWGAAIRRLPKGRAGVVWRNFELAPDERRRRFARARALCRARRLVLILAGPPRLARAWRADGWHGHGRRFASGLLRTAPAHDVKELVDAERAGADLVFLSPVFATASHPGERTLGRVRFNALAVRSKARVAALGGVTPRRMRGLRCWGFGAIDYWTS